MLWRRHLVSMRRDQRGAALLMRRMPLVHYGVAAGLLVVAGGACTPALVPAPVPARPSLPPVAVPARAARTVALPARVTGTTWRVRTTANIRVSGQGAAADEQLVETSALVSWTLDRQPSGALKGAGQVDSFTVRTSFDPASDRANDRARGAALPAASALLLLDAVVDSALMRVVTRPPLANECDRPEAGAASLARELLVRVPDGAKVGDRWRDSVVTLVCRAGVPVVVHTSTTSTLSQLDEQQLVIRRELRSALDGKGGSAFRGLELRGTAEGEQRVVISAQRGTVERLEGASVLTLQATERLPGAPPRTQQIVQRVEVRAERAR